MSLIVKNITSFAVLANKIENQLQLADSMKLKKSVIGCKKFLDSYIGNDWKDYTQIDPNKLYTRNKVLERDDFDIYVLTWNPKCRSKIHDHPTSGCLMRVISGTLFECKYQSINNKLQTLSYTSLNNNSESSYIHNDLAYHEVGNSSDELSISIHIYSPKNYIPNTIL